METVYSIYKNNFILPIAVKIAYVSL